jgi:Family of unknown function (DUF6188)
MLYPPPPDDVIQKLKHSEVATVSFGKYVIHIKFDNGNQLSFEAPFRFDSARSVANGSVNEFPLTHSNLMRINGESINEIACDQEDGTLELSFSNGDILVIYADDPGYEAYTLLIDGTEYLV